MKIRLLAASLICALIALPVTRAQDKEDDQTALEAKMEKANGAWRSAKRNADKPDQKDDVLKKLAVVKENLQAGLKLEPAKKADIPADQQPKFVADYRDRLTEMIARIDKLSALVKAGDVEGAQALIAEIDKTQKEAHTQFKKKKSDKK